MDKETLNLDTQQLITYYRQGVAGSTSVLPSIVEVPEAKQLTLDDRTHSLVDFLKRPIDVYKGEWLSTTAAGNDLIPGGISLPAVFFSNPMLKEKLRGFVGLRGTIRARIMINAQKFQQGVLMLYWIPNYDNIKVKAKMIQKSLAGKSGCAHVIINCEGGTEQTIDIPYVNQHIYYNAITNQGNYGRLFMTPLLQLRSAAASSVGVRIQMWMENPQPEFATSAIPVLSQSVSQVEEENMHEDDSLAVAKSKQGLDVSALWNVIKNASATPSYLARTAANTLELMGFQKPTQQASINRTSLRVNSYMANFNGEYMGHKLALAANNELADMKAPAGTDCDEMAISTLVKAPTYYKTFSVKPKGPSDYSENYVVWSDLVHPMKFTASSTQPGAVLDSTFLGYTASAFGQWRGGIKYHFTVAKTCFHSGTLRVSFLPGVYAAPKGLPNAYDPQSPDYKPEYQMERCYQRTYDLRDLTEFSFVVPFVSTRPFLANVNPFSSAASAVHQRNWASGIIVVDVFIPVVAPDAVSQEFQVAVWVSGAEDLTFANPTAPNIYPYTPPVAVQSQSFSLDEGVDRTQAITSTDENLNNSAPKTSFHPSALCTGEVVASVKALCGRFGPFWRGGDVTINKAFLIAPFHFQDPVTSANQAVTFDYIDYFSYLYGFYRGGLRLCLDPGSPPTEENILWRVVMRSALSSLYPIGNIPRAEAVDTSQIALQVTVSPFSSIISKPSLEGTIDVEVPYYNLTHITPVLTANQAQDEVEESNYPSPVVMFSPRRMNAAITETRSPLMFRACSDDFRFMYMLGPPQVMLLQDNPRVIPFQEANVIYAPTYVTNDGSGNFSGAFEFDDFRIANALPGTSYRPATQLLAVSAANDALWLLPNNLAYGFWSANSNSVFNINASYWTNGTNLRMLSNAPTFAFPLNVTAPTFYTVSTTITPATTSTPQAAPVPCLTFVGGVAAIPATNTTITLSGWLSVVLGDIVALQKPLLVFKADSTDSSKLAEATFLDAGYLVTFELENSATSRKLKVSTGDQFWGYVPVSLPSYTGFPPGVTIPTLTAASPIPNTPTKNN